MPVLKKIISLSFPILISQWAGVAFIFFDTIMLGHKNPESVQAMSLALSVFNIVYIGFMGIVHALIPICAQLYGAKQYNHIGEMFGQGIYLSLLLCLAALLLLAKPDILLAMSGDLTEQVKTDIRQYLLISMLALPALLSFRVIYSLCNAVQKTAVIMNIGLIGVGIKFILNYLLIFEPFGLPSLGSFGAALSTFIVAWINIALGFYFIYKTPFFKQFNIRMGKISWKAQKDLFKLGLPMGGSYLVEISAFNAMTLLAAQEGTMVSGANQIIANLNSILYTLPGSLGIAAASLTGEQIGARRFKNAYQIVMNSIVANFIMCALTITGLLIFKSQIIHLYSNTDAIILITSTLFMILPAMVLFDATQCVCSCLLRSYKIATLPFIAQTICFLGIGVTAGWLFAYGPLAGKLQFITSILMPGAPIGISCMWFFCMLSLCVYAILSFTWAVYISKDLYKRFHNEGYRPI